MFERLAEIERRYDELERLIVDPAVIANRREFAKLAKERSQLEETVACWRERRHVSRDGDAGPHPYLHGDGGRPARGGGRRGRPRRQGPPYRRLPLVGPGGAERQHDGLRRPRDAPSDRARRHLPGREVAAQEQGEGPQ